jgi:hypothetical protein
MGAVRGGSLVAVTSVVALGAACSFGIDTSGLTGDGGTGIPDARGTDAAVDAGRDVSRRDGGSDSRADGGVDAGDASDGGEPEASDAPSGPCEITAVQAVPGVGTIYHGIVDGGSKELTITESAGNLLVAVAYGGQGPHTTTPPSTTPNLRFTVTDTLGNTYHAASMYENSRSNQAAIQIFVAPNIKGGANTVTALSTSSAGIVEETGLFLEEYAGAATKDAVDISSGQMAPSLSTQVVPGPMTTAASCDWTVAAFADGHVTEQMDTAGSGWTLSNTDFWDPAVQVDPVGGPVPAGTVVNAIMDLKAADDGWVAAQVAFRSSTTAALPQPDRIAFDTPAQTVTAGVCSKPVTLRSDHGTTRTRSSGGIGMTLSGAGLTFYADPACAYPITDLLIGAGTASQTFYFQGSTAGVTLLTATPGTATGLAAVSQKETVN